MILLFTTTLLICLSLYALLTLCKLTSTSEKIVAAVLIISAQIILTETLLGIMKILTAGYLVFINSSISLALIILVYKKQNNIVGLFANDVNKISQFLKSLNSPYIIFLLILLCLVSFWLFLSALLLPPRGIDDLTYHLPAVYEFINHEKIFLVAINYRGHFAFPMNAELLFLWPVIFIKNLIPIGLVQYFYGLYAVVVIYALSKEMRLKTQTSMFIGLCFFFSPVVLAQAGVGYIDLIVSVFYLTAIFFSVRFYRTQRPIYLYLCAVSIGLIVGMKYTMLLCALVLQVLILPGLSRKKLKQAGLYLFIITIFCSYWYLRNFLILGHPFYPFNISGLESTYTSFSDLSVLNIISKYLTILKLFFTKDWGIGSYNGGYGIIFWGLAFPSWIYLFVKSIISKSENRLINLFMWIQIPVGFTFFLIVPIDEFHLYPRFSIFMISIGLIAFGMVIEKFNKNQIYKNAVLFCICIFCFVSTFQLARAKLPSHAIDAPIYDYINKKNYSNIRYLRVASTSASFLWETLDFITLNNETGLDCYFASSLLDYVGPIYGSKLQNRVWNFKEDKSSSPDALIFLIHEEDKVKYYGKKITIDEVINNIDYVLIDIAQKAYLYLNKDFLDKDSEIQKSLIKHYENYYNKEIKVASTLRNKINTDTPIIASDYYGIGLQYLSMTENIRNSVLMLPEGKENKFLGENVTGSFYSVNKKYKGYNSKLVYKIRINKDENVILYLNSKK